MLYFPAIRARMDASFLQKGMPSPHHDLAKVVELMNDTIIVPRQPKNSSEQNKHALNMRGFGKDFFDMQIHPRRAAFRDITLLFLVSRLLFLLVTYIGVPLFTLEKYSSNAIGSPQDTPLQYLLQAWNQWDA